MARHTPGSHFSDGCGGGGSQIRKQERRLPGVGCPGGSDEASGHPRMCRGPPGAWTRPAAIPGLAGGPPRFGRGQQPPQDVHGGPGGPDEARCCPGTRRRVLGAQMRPAAVPGCAWGSRGPGRGQRLPGSCRGPPGAQTRPAAVPGCTDARWAGQSPGRGRATPGEAGP